jgi:hypothetical protein
VDDTKVATQTLQQDRPGEFRNAVIPLAPALTAGKQKVTVKYQSHPGHKAGRLFGARVMRAQ